MDIARKAVAVTPHATNPVTGGQCDFLFVGGAGNVVCRPDGADADVTFAAVAGQYIWCTITHVRDTSTATGMVAMYT